MKKGNKYCIYIIKRTNNLRQFFLEKRTPIMRQRTIILETLVNIFLFVIHISEPLK